MPSAYDEVPYSGRAFPQTHPDHLAVLARLFGISPAPAEKCRVLELGSADGGNLIPMAYTLPGSEFVGLDLNAASVARGQSLAERLGLRNLRLECRDILDWSEDPGHFDYVILHGVYSWVPAPVQDRILRICRAQLRRNGVAYISYNTYPGGHARRMLSEMLKYHLRRFEKPGERIEQSRAFLALLAAYSQDNGYRALLREEVDMAAGRRDANLYHDDLAEFNTPFYFEEFMLHAGRHGLQFLAEADFFEMHDFGEAPELAAALRACGRNLVELEQYRDFLKCRRFRQTLLCHSEVQLNRRLESGLMRQFCFSLAPQVAAAGGQADLAAFRLPGFHPEHPLSWAAIAALKERWPCDVAFAELLRCIGCASEEDAAVLCDVLLASFAAGMVEAHERAPRFSMQVSARPAASPVARAQALADVLVTNLRHESVELQDDVSRHLVAALDGTRDRQAVLEYLRENADPGALTAAELEANLERNLKDLAKCALLEA
jgi:SAM-dependent methyltransferase